MLSKRIAEDLLRIKAVSIVDENNLFTWVSGIKSPIYCDNRMTISYPDVRTQIAKGFSDLITEEFPQVDIVAGTATAGIPHAAWVADLLNKPMVYVRSAAKGHGKGRQTEGMSVEGKTVVLIEDLLSTGGSSLKAVDALIEEGATVLKVYAIFSYNFDSMEERFEAAKMPFATLSDYKALLPVAVEKNYVEEASLETLLKWSKNPRLFTDK